MLHLGFLVLCSFCLLLTFFVNLVLHASQHEFLFEHDGVKLILGTHDHVEQ